MKALPIALSLALLTSGCGYNRIQELDESVEQMRSNIDTELQRRADLIPNLVRTVDEAAEFEQETQTRVAEARSGLTAAREQLNQALQSNAEAGEVSEANAAMSRNLDLFINVAVEAYPNLRANESFLRLQDELTETENRISVSRRDYNEQVAAYNTYIRRFPQAITAKVIGADRKEQFQADPESRRAPTVDFDSDDRAPAPQTPAATPQAPASAPRP
ncbi:MAG TPA: LemA family protein [Longimicrobiales bacterium]|nr:LemA family protein [Longimicrobiales bacterium]